MKCIVKVVRTKKEMNDFVSLPSKIYKGNGCYVPDLERDVRGWFDAKHNPGLGHCDVKPFIAYSEEGEPVGRIVGIINHKANKIWKGNCIRFGWIEFVDDADVSAALLGAVEDWGREKGMDSIQGPLGISDFDKEGMLVEDFDQMGTAVTIYNPSYYPRHMEQLGFGKEVDWVQARVRVPEEVPERFARAQKLVSEMYGLKVRKLTHDDIFKHGYGRKIFHLLNEAYSQLFGYTPHSDEEADAFVSEYISMLDLNMLPMVEDSEGNLIACSVTMPNLSRALQKSGGRLLPFGWFHLLRALKFKHEDEVELLLIAVHPEWQALGVNALLFADLIPIFNKKGFHWAETGPMLENNTKVLTQWKVLDSTICKRRRCFSKEINRQQTTK
ncbi:MAG: N-acetyltransferase [Bacteroidaceae bacterium]|nr:N-acetyltransferase [Bacteroidaceae bacterium]